MPRRKGLDAFIVIAICIPKMQPKKKSIYVIVRVTIGLEGNRRDYNTIEKQRNSIVIVIY
jgi:hypothetical protein